MSEADTAVVISALREHYEGDALTVREVAAFIYPKPTSRDLSNVRAALNTAVALRLATIRLNREAMSVYMPTETTGTRAGEKGNHDRD